MSTANKKFPDTLIGQRCREAREEALMSRREAADALACSLSTLKFIELGRIQLTAKRMKHMSRLYGVPLEHFVQDI